MKRLALVALFGAATSLFAQTDALPDCRQPSLTLGEKCVYRNTELPVQRYLGDVAFPPDQHAHFTSPLLPGSPAPAPILAYGHKLDLGAFGVVQTETLGYKRYVTGGFKLTAHRQWSDLRGLEVRGSIIRYDIGVGELPGQNHTEAIAFGPRIQHSFGRVTPYGEVLIGALYQYYAGMSESGAVGAEIRLNRRFSLVPAEVEYRYASLQDSTRVANPRRGRIEVEAGLVYHFGS